MFVLVGLNFYIERMRRFYIEEAVRIFSGCDCVVYQALLFSYTAVAYVGFL